MIKYDKKKKIFYYFFLTIIFLILIELISFSIIKFKVGINYLNIFYGVKEFSTDNLKIYLKHKDPLLGWPIKHKNNKLYKQYNSIGSRISPANKLINNKTSISVYGDSFTFSSDVEHNYAWANLLAKKLNLKVLNYGVPGYGVDQAVLKFINNVNDKSKLVILGIYPDDIERNLSQNYSIIADNELDIFSFKPKFKINQNDEIELIQMPINSLKDANNFIENYDEFLKNDEIIHKFNKKLIKPYFPYTLTIIKSLQNFLEKKRGYISKIGLLPDTLPFWIRNPESLKLNSKIVNLFLKNCEEKNLNCKIMIIPDYTSLSYYQSSGKNINKKIYENYNWSKHVWDSTTWLASKMRKPSLCYYLGNSRDCNGHYNIEGNAIISNFLYKKIMDNKFLYKNN